MINEHWLPVVGYEGLYEVSDLGRVRSLPRQTVSGVRGGQIIKPSKNSPNQEYLKVVLSNKLREQILVHRIVLEAFVGPCPDGMEACHFPDRNPINNRLSNLRWDTPVNNSEDKLTHGTHNKGIRHGLSKLTEDDIRRIHELRSEGLSHSKIAHLLGGCRSNVSLILGGKRWSHVGGAA